MAIDAKTLDREEQIELRRKVEAHLRDPWAMDDQHQLVESAIFLMPGAVRDFLLHLAASTTELQSKGKSRDEQYEWLEDRRDKSSNLERGLLKILHETGRRLPDRAQYRPTTDVHAEADFYYDRDSVPGVCVFCDGPEHDEPARKSKDEDTRNVLQDMGYRVIVIRSDQPLDGQITEHEDVFGPGIAKEPVGREDSNGRS